MLSSGALAQAPTVQPTAETREIGPWLLVCTADPITDRTDCTLRHRLWIVPPEGGEGPGIALEIVLRDGRALPAVTARGLTLADTARGALAFAANAELRLDQAPALELPCGLEGRDAVCLPAGEPATRVEAALAVAARALDEGRHGDEHRDREHLEQDPAQRVARHRGGWWRGFACHV